MENDIKVRAKATPRDVFLHLFAAGLLYASAVSLMALLFQYVNKFFPDPLAYDGGLPDAVRWSVAMLIILFPVLVWLSRVLQNDIKADAAKATIAVRRWLIHFTLFVAAITIVVDLVTLVYRFLGGELSARFGLKVIAVLVVALLVFGYFLMDLRRGSEEVPKKMAWLMQGATALVAVAVVGGFFLAGSPTRERDRQFDERRVNDLSSIQNEVINYWTLKRKLPVDLAALEEPVRGFKPPMDPQTSAPYEYRVLGATAFELCVTFTTDSTAVSKPVTPYPDSYLSSWNHGVGRVCFERTIDPELYPKP